MIYLEAVRWPVVLLDSDQCSISNFLASWEHRKTDHAHIHWTSMLWSIDSCQNMVSADQDHLTVSRAQVLTYQGQVFFEVIRWQVTSFQMIAGSSLIFFKFKWNMFCFCAAQLKSWFKTDLGRENSANYYRQRRQLLLTLLTIVTHWSRSTSKFYALVGQNLSGELMRKIYAASWILFTLRAEADRVLCQLVMF